MSLDDFIDLEETHNLLGLGDDTSFDEVISYTLLPYTYLTFSMLSITEDNLTNYTDQQISNIKILIAANIGCMLIKKDPDFGQKHNVKKVGNVTESYLRRVGDDVQDWCVFADELIDEIEASLGISYGQTAERPGLSDEFSEPY